MSESFRCRACGRSDHRTVIALGDLPPANALRDPRDRDRPERRYPLTVVACRACGLVQLADAPPPEILFGDYVYFSSYSTSWVDHARRYAAQAVRGLGLDGTSLVVEAASNDGYLLRHFRDRGIPVLGIEPAANVAAVAAAAGIPTERRFFGRETARDLAARGMRADLAVANNVLAHVPDLTGFVEGLALLLKPHGVVTCEFPHLLRFLEGTQFDTVYHEHVSYLSLGVVERVMGAHGLTVFDVEELPTHGGSLRVWAHRADGRARDVGPGVAKVRGDERAAGLEGEEVYRDFALRVERCRRSLAAFLGECRREGRRVVGYGAAAKGTVLLNVCGVGPGDLECVVDVSPHKQGRLVPGCGIAIESPERVFAIRPDYLLILPWNLREEICGRMAGIAAWGGRFVIAVPETRVLP